MLVSMFTSMDCADGTRARLADLVVVLATRSRCVGQGIGTRLDVRDGRVESISSILRPMKLSY